MDSCISWVHYGWLKFRLELPGLMGAYFYIDSDPVFVISKSYWRSPDLHFLDFRPLTLVNVTMPGGQAGCIVNEHHDTKDDYAQNILADKK